MGTQQQVHCMVNRRVLIEVPSIKHASGNVGLQILQQWDFQRNKADGGPPSMEVSTQEEGEVHPPPYNWRVIAGIVCVPNYWVIQAKSDADMEEPAGNAEASRQ